MHRHQKSPLRLAVLLGLALTLAFTLVNAFPAKAVEFTDDGIIAEDEVLNDDIFISTTTVIMDGTVNGDLFINSNTAVINGTVNGNLITNVAEMELNGTVNGSVVFMGQVCEITGEVNGSVYAAASTMTLDRQAYVKRNVYYAGFSLETEPGSEIGQDLLVTGFQALLYGQTGRDIDASVAAFELGGEVGRNIDVEVDAPGEGPVFLFSFPFFQGAAAPPAIVDSGLRILESAQVGGDIVYRSSVEQPEGIQSVPEGEIVFAIIDKNMEATIKAETGSWAWRRIGELASLLIVGGLTWWLLPGPLRVVSEKARAKPLSSTGWGFATLILGFLLAFALAVAIVLISILVSVVSLGGLSRVIIGIGFSSLGLAMSVYLLLIAYGSKVIVAYLGGKVIFDKISPAHTEEQRLRVRVVGVLIYALLRAIPVLGLVFGALATFIGMGAMWLVFKDWKMTCKAGADEEPALATLA